MVLLLPGVVASADADAAAEPLAASNLGGLLWVVLDKLCAVLDKLWVVLDKLWIA